MDERGFLERVIARFASPRRAGEVGPGDDAAVFTPPPGMAVAATVDAMVGGTHFLAGWLTDRELGARILRVSLSDLAAMGAMPRGALLAVETPELPGRITDSFWDGIEETLREYDFALLGGNVTRTSGPLALTSTLFGLVPAGTELSRSGAAPGDALWVTGAPGRAGRGRLDLARGEGQTACALAWRRPLPRILEARWLRDECQPSAAIDLSDGLGIDCARLLAASRVGADIDLAELVSGETPPLAVTEILEGGEDYELLLALPPERAPDAARFRALFGTALTRIGTVTAKRGLRIAGGGASEEFRGGGWDPFAGGASNAAGVTPAGR